MSNYSETVEQQVSQKFSFDKGWGQVQQKDVSNVRDELMAVLNLTTRQGFLNRKRGDIEPKVSEVQAIEAIFHKYGIKNIWGN